MGCSTPVTVRSQGVEKAVADDTITSSFASPGASEAEKAAPLRKSAIVSLGFVDMSGKESHWKMNAFGEAIVPSPIPVLPKPLALSYRNFYNHYEEHDFLKRVKEQTGYPRVLVGCSLVSAMLRHYFPSVEYVVKQVWPSTSTGAEFTHDAVVNGVPIAGTRHWAVQKKSDAAITVLVVIVTDPEFCMPPARTAPAHLAVTKNHLESRHRLTIHGDRMSRGAVILLACAGSPLKPTFEFYHFDSSHEQKGLLAPMATHAQDSQGAASNSISLAPELAEQVDHTFKTIVRASSGQAGWPQALTPSPTQMAPVLTLLPKRKAKHTSNASPAPKINRLQFSPQARLPLTPAATAPNSPATIIVPVSARHSIEVKNDKTRKMEHHEISEDYVRTVKMNKSGNLIEAFGRMIPNGKSKAVRQVAEAMGHTFNRPDNWVGLAGEDGRAERRK
ncbi:uncharacterized protein N0V89_003308 [Didymosphaeria variabile]|uniref:Uncharacterized protein n=1 Tax=Didymosphaeria variabile TaxID=1932322 RepID=A0A9W8XUB3_9PLEO|nr:uncharacterized protein N0V89_003308 [Didymosphaeria variabile]KAJ4358724.1 hypothetical protein N0V89_003308 [Didymosphaeria variabile]